MNFKFAMIISIFILALFLIGCGIEGTTSNKNQQKITGESVDEMQTESSKAQRDKSLSDNLNQLKDTLEETSEITSKINKCTKACLEEEGYNIPSIKNEMYVVCSDAYYSGGEETLDALIETCMNSASNLNDIGESPEIREETPPEETEIIEPTEDPIDTSFSDALNELKNALEETNKVNSKIDECTKACAGEDYDIPIIKAEFQSTCYQMYYYGGEEKLNEYIQECKGS